MNMTVYLPDTREINLFFIEAEGFIFKIQSSNTKVEVTDEGRRPTDLHTLEFESISGFREFLETHNINANDVIFCISFLAKLKNHYP